MSDSPRPANPMAAHMQSSVLCGALALAGAAVLSVSSGAATARHATPAHGDAAHTHAAAHISAEPRVHGRPAARARARTPVTHQPRTTTRQAGIPLHRQRGRYATTIVITHAAKFDPHEAALTKALQNRPQVPQRQTATQQATEDRVHAWYRTQHPESASRNEAPVADGGAPAAKPVISKATEASITSPAAQATAAPIIRMSPAALQTDETLHASAAARPSPTSTDDNAAISEESHIPSTAPTERTAIPFTHGDFNLSTAPGQAAPVLRASSPAASALLASNSTTPVPVPSAAQQSLTAGIPPAHSQGVPTVRTKADAMFSPADEDAANAASLVKVNLYDSAGKLILIPPMKGTHDILVHQNTMAAADGLKRIANDAQLSEMRRAHLLVALPETAGIGVDERLPLNRRYARPWSVRFLNDLARAHYARFHTPLIVTSAVRTVAFQRHLVLVNGNAAPPTGDIASPHLYGQAVDIAKHGMTLTELAWMRAYLTPVETDGKIDVEEEFQQACFHISIYRSYLGASGQQPAPVQELPPVHTLQQAKTAPAKHRHIPTALLAMRLR